MTVDLAIALTLRIAAVGVVVSSLEYVSRPALLADQALASWTVARTNRRWKFAGHLARPLDMMFAYPTFLIVPWVRLLSAVAVVVGVPDPTMAIACIALTSALMATRSPYGTDGADQMFFVIFLAAAMALPISSPVAKQAFLLFVAAQSCFAYFVSGAAKLISPIWRSGKAIPGVLGTDCYGDRNLGRWLAARPILSRAASWFVILFECAFPLVLLGVAPLSTFLLLAAFAFHLGTVFVMRLNTFIWAFVGTYPAVLWSIEFIHGR